MWKGILATCLQQGIILITFSLNCSVSDIMGWYQMTLDSNTETELFLRNILQMFKFGGWRERGINRNNTWRSWKFPEEVKQNIRDFPKEQAERTSGGTGKLEDGMITQGREKQHLNIRSMSNRVGNRHPHRFSHQAAHWSEVLARAETGAVGTCTTDINIVSTCLPSTYKFYPGWM